jgi:hypothetical protein
MKCIGTLIHCHDGSGPSQTLLVRENLQKDPMFALSQLSTLVMPADDSGGEIDEGLWASLQCSRNFCKGFYGFRSPGCQ